MSAVAWMRLRRAPLLALGLVALFAGMWGGLIRLGLVVPGPLATAAAAHGTLMTLGFLGTLVSLERAVALGRAWAYTAPAAAATGTLAGLAAVPHALGPALVTFAGAVLLAAHLALQRHQPSAHNAVMGLGALAWCAAAIMWLRGGDPAQFAPLLAGFLVLTIVGERLELTRAAHRGPRARRMLLAAVAVFAAGLAVSVAAERLGARIAGAGLLAQALWLARYDIARRTVRIGGVTRYMATALLAGYVWLGCAGVLWMAYAAFDDGSAYDASLHAVFLGFVMSMVFAHAPVIVPSVMRVPLTYRRSFYAHLVLLHVSLAVRLVGGDAAGDLVLWQWGGVLSGVAIVLFRAATAVAVAASRAWTPRGRSSAAARPWPRRRRRGPAHAAGPADRLPG
jgi:hypothetical protein